jgi:hypothetical protein
VNDQVISQTSTESSSGTITEGFDGAENGYGPGKLEFSGDEGFEASTADNEGASGAGEEEQESKAVDHDTPSGKTDPDTTGDWQPAKWNNIYCDPALYKIVSTWSGTEEAYPVAVEMVGVDDNELMGFVYNGKTVREYVDKTEYNSNRADDLQMIRQYALGNGTSLSVIEQIDETFRTQYLKDGSADEYDLDKVESDIDMYFNEVRKADSEYNEAYRAFRRYKLNAVSEELKDAGINAELSDDDLLRFITGAEQLSKAKISDEKNYCFLYDQSDNDDITMEYGGDEEAADEEEKIYTGC